MFSNEKETKNKTVSDFCFINNMFFTFACKNSDHGKDWLEVEQCDINHNIQMIHIILARRS